MRPDLLFTAGSAIAALGWLALGMSLFVVSVRPGVWRATGIFIPASLASAYIVLLTIGWRDAPGGGFNSIDAVRALFANDAALTAGWLHYLAFDLFVGTWIVREGLKRGVSPLLLLLCLPLTFLFGPAGLLLFLIIRLATKKEPAS